MPGNGVEPPRPRRGRLRRCGAPLICVCMATFDPPLELLRAQIESLRGAGRRALDLPDRRRLLDGGQAGRGPGAGRRGRALRAARARRAGRPLPELRAGAGAGPRERRADRALRPGRPLAPGQAEALRGALGAGAELAYSDMRIVDRTGRSSRRPTGRRANNYTNLADLVIVNTVTGAASLFRRALLDYALPFPRPGPDSYPRSLGRRRRAGGGPDRATSTARSTTTSSTPTQRSATASPTSRRSSRRCGNGSPAGATAGGWPAGGATTRTCCGCC